MKSDEPGSELAKRKLELVRLRAAYDKVVEDGLHSAKVYEEIIEDIKHARHHIKTGELDKAELHVRTALRRWAQKGR